METGVIENALLIPLSELPGRVDELEGKGKLVVNCASGYRARFAWSILQKAGITDSVVLDEGNLR